MPEHDRTPADPVHTGPLAALPAASHAARSLPAVDDAFYPAPARRGPQPDYPPRLGPSAKTHVTRAIGKLGVRVRVQLVILAYETGLVRPGEA